MKTESVNNENRKCKSKKSLNTKSVITILCDKVVGKMVVFVALTKSAEKLEKVST